MWFELDASGIKIKLRIKGYRPSTKKNWDSTWCSCDFLFSSGDWLNYHREDDAILLSCEVEELEEALTKLLNGELVTEKEVSTLEPDFRFFLHPVLKEKQTMNGQPWYDIEGMYLEWKVYFWDDGLTDNHLTIVLDKQEIVQLREYFRKIMNK